MMKNAVLYFRAAVFNVFFVFWALILPIFTVWIAALPKDMVFACLRAWQSGLGVAEKWILGITYDVKGIENIPEGCCIIASKHQSMWETCKLHVLFHQPAIVLKEELVRIPIWGWYGRASGAIPVDRASGGRALIKMMNAAKRAKEAGRPIVLFPQGTRLLPGAKEPYKVGVAALYQALKVPVVPVALNSGLYWPKKQFIKKPGVIKVEILPAIPSNLSRAEMMRQLEEKIETASDRLCGIEAKA